MQRRRPNRLVYQEHQPFYRWCWIAAADMVAARDELNALVDEHDRSSAKWTRVADRKALELRDEYERSLVAAPVFAVMAAEQLIFTYAMHRLAKKVDIALEHLDRLDTEAKWRVIPPFACGKELSADSEAIRSLRQVIRLRNSFVHPKPTIILNPTDEKIDNWTKKVDGQDRQRFHIAKNAPSVVEQLARELLALDRHSTVRTVLRRAGVRVSAEK